MELQRYILKMRHWPGLSIYPDHPGQLEFVDQERRYWKHKTLWLLYLLTDRQDLRATLFNTPDLLRCKPSADLSVSLFSLCRQVFDRSPRIQETADSFQELWHLCEYSESQNRLRSAWLSGLPETTAQGKIRGKTQLLRDCDQALGLYQKALNKGWGVVEALDPENNLLPPEEIESLADGTDDFSPEFHLEAFVLLEAQHLALDDPDLKHHLSQYLNSKRNFNRIAKADNRQQVSYLPSPESAIRFSGRSKKAPKVEGFLPPKRGRGRPPKGFQGGVL